MSKMVGDKGNETSVAFPRVLMAHARYSQSGGEERSLANEVELLESFGHEVMVFETENEAFHGGSGVKKATNVVWNSEIYRRMRSEIRRFRPSVLHVQNPFPALSPSVYYAAHAERVPVVQHIRNFRLTCVNGFLFRNGAPCEACVGSPVPWRGVVHRCYRESAVASGAVASMIAAHKSLGTWQRRVNRYVCLSDFQRNMLRDVLPDDCVSIRPNFLTRDPGPGTGGGPALFVGRLSPEKGIEYLLKAADLAPDVEIEIAGDGPMRGMVEAATDRLANVTYLGERNDVIDRMGQASVVLVPSQWYEGFPRVIIEAFSRGTPVLATRLGTSIEVIAHGVTGWLADHRDPSAFADSLRSSRSSAQAIRGQVRGAFLQDYTADRAHQRLVEIYSAASDDAKRSRKRDAT